MVIFYIWKVIHILMLEVDVSVSIEIDGKMPKTQEIPPSCQLNVTILLRFFNPFDLFKWISDTKKNQQKQKKGQTDPDPSFDSEGPFNQKRGISYTELDRLSASEFNQYLSFQRIINVSIHDLNGLQKWLKKGSRGWHNSSHFELYLQQGQTARTLQEQRNCAIIVVHQQHNRK